MKKTIKSRHLIIGSLFVGAVLSLFASSSPDGLEKVGEEAGFADQSAPAFPALISDYLVLGVSHDLLAVSLAGIVGTLIVGGVLYLVGRNLFQVRNQ